MWLNAFLTVDVPAPDEPVIAITGCFFDIQTSLSFKNFKYKYYLTNFIGCPPIKFIGA
jgi:hypothetical protein